MKITTLLLSGIAVLSLAACIEATGEKTDPSATTPPAIEDTAPTEPALPGKVFDGATEQRDAYEPPLGLYNIDMTIVSDAGQPNAEYNETSPAMPFVSTGFAVYLNRESYRLQVSMAGNERAEYDGGNAGEETTIRFINAIDGSAILLNGESVWTGPRALPLQYSSFGRGFKDRYWKGRLVSGKVCSIPETASVTDVSLISTCS